MKRPAVSTQRRSSDGTASISHNLPRSLPTFRRKSDMTWYTTPPSRIVRSTRGKGVQTTLAEVSPSRECAICENGIETQP